MQQFLIFLSEGPFIYEIRITLDCVDSTSIKMEKNLILYLSQAFLSFKDMCLLLIGVVKSDDV